MSFLLGDTIQLSSSAVNQSASNFTTTYQIPLPIYGDSRIALVGYSLWNTEPNVVNPTNSNVTITQSVGSLTASISLPTGLYEIPDIAAFISNACIAAGISYTSGGATISSVTFGEYGPTDSTTWSTTDPTNGGTITITMTTGFAEFTGWQTEPVLGPGLVVNKIYYSPNAADIQNGFTSFNIYCSAVFGGSSFSVGNTNFSNSATLQQSTVLYNDSFSQTPPNALQSVIINPPLFLAIDPGFKSAKSITITVTDQNSNVISFNQGGNFNNNASTFYIMFARDAIGMFIAIRDNTSFLSGISKTCQDAFNWLVSKAKGPVQQSGSGANWGRLSDEEDFERTYPPELQSGPMGGRLIKRGAGRKRN
jgi:hypothetical protein